MELNIKVDWKTSSTTFASGREKQQSQVKDLNLMGSTFRIILIELITHYTVEIMGFDLKFVEIFIDFYIYTHTHLYSVLKTVDSDELAS